MSPLSQQRLSGRRRVEDTIWLHCLKRAEECGLLISEAIIDYRHGGRRREPARGSNRIGALEAVLL
jgi:hypothetical protein